MVGKDKHDSETPYEISLSMEIADRLENWAKERKTGFQSKIKEERLNENRHKNLGEFLKKQDTFSSITELSPIATYFALPDLSDEFTFIVKSFQFNENFTSATMLIEIQNKLYYKNIEIIRLAAEVSEHLDSYEPEDPEYKSLLLQVRTFFAVTIPEIAERIRKIAEMTKEKMVELQPSLKTSKENWEAIKSEYGISKIEFGKKINFVSDQFKRDVIFRDVEQAFVLASHGFAKPAVILAGGVIEELLKQYLKHKEIQPKDDRFIEYIRACDNNRLLKHGVSRLSDSIRDFRNLVHISEEETRRYTISKATAKGAVSSIFTIANDFL